MNERQLGGFVLLNTEKNLFTYLLSKCVGLGGFESMSESKNETFEMSTAFKDMYRNSWHFTSFIFGCFILCWSLNRHDGMFL